ncbi:MAG: hypothetical protein QG657_5383 [Acidobacteriota bacterium]|nr:hypothetical protein [Acidobacteriota bacterium]
MKSKKFLRMFVGILFIVWLGSSAFPWWTINRSGSGFEAPSGLTATINLENYVVQGAGYFLDSYANTLLFMKKLELGGESSLKEADTSLLLDVALKNMEQANKTYLELKRLADITPYNVSAIDGLMKFDYENFRTVYDIEDKSFDRARAFLGKGDIRAIYGAMVYDTETILKLLLRVKAQLLAGTFPSTWDVWKLDRAYSDTARFGQYVSRIFDALDGDGNI